MTDHILSATKKCVPDISGRFFDSGGLNGPYTSFEEDYFIIREVSTPAGAQFLNMVMTSWDVRDFGVTTPATTTYDYIDVFTSTTGFPNSWTWYSRIGGIIHNSATFGAGDPFFIILGANPAYVKFCFKSRAGQNFGFSGWEINYTTAPALVGANLATGESITHYNDILNIQENCLDNILAGTSQNFGGIYNQTYFNEADPGTSHWDYIPKGQFDNETHNLEQNYIQFAVDPVLATRPPGAPFSYVAEDQHKIGQLGTVRLDTRGDTEFIE
jgi:hypothetical protein